MNILDELLEKDIIDQDRYDAGLKLRKMHDIIFGSAVIKAYDPSRVRGRSCRKINEEYLFNIESEYQLIIAVLVKNNFWDMVSEVCIYQEYNIPLRNIDRVSYISHLKDGLEIVSSHFKNGRKIYGKFKNFNNKVKNFGFV